MPNGQISSLGQFPLTNNGNRYWWNLNQGPSNPTQTYQYHLQTYGPHVVYDDFIQNFTADAWDPKEWVDLFADAGANYFVQVSKHHDGFALFTAGSDVSKRTAVDLGPRRNLLQVNFSFNDYQS
jgi:alpha-L-fucosidase